MRRALVLFLLLGALAFALHRWQERSSLGQLREVPVPTIDKRPVTLANRTFDPAAPPADMPPLSPGEDAECDSDFLSNASVDGESRQSDATHATVTVTQVKVTLQLNVAIWVPMGVTQRVIEHEDGHRQISEFYYQSANKVAERIAAAYIGQQFQISGPDLGAESGKILRQVAADITDEYGKELSPSSTQLLYDQITDHSRNDIPVKDAIAVALKDLKIASIHADGFANERPGN